MATAKSKTIELLLYDGSLNGVFRVESPCWHCGRLFSAPRESVDALLQTEACSQLGVYLLLSDGLVYVGQALELAKELKQGLIDKPWWEKVVVLSASNNELARSDVEYLETALIEKAIELNRLSPDKVKKSSLSIDSFRKAMLDQYLEDALFMLEFLGIKVFDESAKTVEKMKNQLELRTKQQVRIYLEQRGIILRKGFNCATRQETNNWFWMNPKTDVLESDWDFVLHNQFTRELIVFRVPANTFCMEGCGCLLARTDKPYYIDMAIVAGTLIERKSGADFSPYVIHHIKY